MHQKLLCFIFISTFYVGNFASASTSKIFTLADYSSHEQVSLDDYKGQVVYLDFWASWCKPCRSSFPWMNNMQTKYGEIGFAVVSINLDQDTSSISQFLKNYPANFTILLDPDGEVASQYELVGMPSSYLVDKEGRLRKSHTGFFIKNQAIYEQEIVDLMSE
jgi:thiol-disulfide isomerase/thioredoxin